MQQPLLWDVVLGTVALRAIGRGHCPFTMFDFEHDHDEPVWCFGTWHSMTFDGFEHHTTQVYTQIKGRISPEHHGIETALCRSAFNVGVNTMAMTVTLFLELLSTEALHAEWHDAVHAL